jgi:hypothetical protein
MTTSNVIYTNTYQDTLFIPADAVYQNDSMQYVYLRKDRITRQVVKLGESNENYVIVAKGLKEGDQICLNEPEGAQDLPFAGLEIYAEIKKEKKEKEQKEEQERSAELMKRNSPVASSEAPRANAVSQ